jgi:rRNA maturation endonuclease Nob1
MYCRLCDIEYPKSLRFCKWCGGGLVNREASSNQRCPSCGSEVEREWVFCNECGVDLATLGAQPKDVLCPACSATVRKGWMFCRQCGEQVATERARHYGSIARDAMGIFADGPAKHAMLQAIDFCIHRAY